MIFYNVWGMITNDFYASVPTAIAGVVMFDALELFSWTWVQIIRARGSRGHGVARDTNVPSVEES